MAPSPWGKIPGVRPRLGLVIGLAAVGTVAALSALFAPAAQPISGRADVVDGDTLRIGDVRIRLTGLDAPELGQTCTDVLGASWSCGQEARGFVVGVVAGQTVSCTPTGRDRYGRTLARCSVAGADLGGQIVEAGWAVADMGYFAEAADAQTARRGIWAGTFEAPAQWRRDGGASGASFWDWLRRWFG